MAKAVDYKLGPNTFPRGWFVVAESHELDAGPLAVRFFGQDLALYRGESGNPVMLDAYCSHMGTHLAASNSAMIVKNGGQIEGDSIRCPYHGWRYNAAGEDKTVQGHQHRFGITVNRRKGIVITLVHRDDFSAVSRQLLNINAGTETSTFGPQDNDPDLVIFA